MSSDQLQYLYVDVHTSYIHGNFMSIFVEKVIC